jgi:hypothetical protein
MMRENCFAKIHSSGDCNGKTVAHHPLDDIIENIYKAN